MIRIFIISIIISLSGCVSHDTATLQSLSLPRNDQGHCCWQALQELKINHDNKQYTLTASLAHHKNGLSFVLLDPFGQRLLSLQQNQKLEIYRSPELPESLPEHFLLAALYLTWWPIESWKNNDGNHWEITESDNFQSRIVSYKSRPILTLKYTRPSNKISNKQVPQVGEAVTLTHHHQSLTITITTKQWQSL